MQQIQKINRELLIEAQRIIDNIHNNHLHPANDIKHPMHQEALEALSELEDIVFELTMQRDNQHNKQSD